MYRQVVYLEDALLSPKLQEIEWNTANFLKNICPSGLTKCFCKYLGLTGLRTFRYLFMIYVGVTCFVQACRNLTKNINNFHDIPGININNFEHLPSPASKVQIYLTWPILYNFSVRLGFSSGMNFYFGQVNWRIP